MMWVVKERLLLLILCLHASRSVRSHKTAKEVISHKTAKGVISHFPSWQAANLAYFTEVINSGLRWKYYEHTDDGVNWQLNFNDMLASPLAGQLTKLAEVDREKVHFQNATGRILRRGDNVKINRMCKDPDQSGTVILQVLFTPSDKNDYAEIMFFDDSLSDIITTIRPGNSSVISFPCRQAYQWQYPAIQTQQGMVFLQLLFVEKGWVDSGDVLDSSNIRAFPSSLEPYSKLGKADLEVKVTSSFNLTSRKPVLILDNLFDDETLSELARYFVDSSLYTYNPVDEAGESDNVVFLAFKSLLALAKTRVWAVLEQAMAHLTGKEGWFPYDVSNNLNEPWDHTRIHPDCFGRDEYTLLLYLNKEYQPGDLGGTLWYTAEDGAHVLGSVMNKWGRLAVFHCSIPHAARPPHAYNRPGPRLTFAVKVSGGRSVAVVRGLSELIANIQPVEEDEVEEELLERLQNELGGNPSKLEVAYQEMVEDKEKDQEQMLEEMLRTVTVSTEGKRTPDTPPDDDSHDDEDENYHSNTKYEL